MIQASDVTAPALFQVLELGLDAGPKELRASEAKFRALWEQATPKVRAEKNAQGQTLLHVMVLYGFHQLVQETLQTMPALAMQHGKQNGDYPIHTAVLNHQLEVVKLLLAVPGVGRLKNTLHQSALHYAARFGSQDMMRVCCESCPTEINQKDRLGKTPLALAQAENTPDVEAVLLSYGADPNLI